MKKLRELIALPFKVISVALMLMSIVFALFTAFIRGGSKNLELSFNKIDKWLEENYDK
ncbi:hypothetical protein VPHK122_0034 [Vibrio phage K122]